MDRYQRVERPRAESAINENEIRITAQGLVRNYLSYASTLLQEKKAKEIVLKAMGQAINKTVTITEIIKKRIPGLYQDIAISSVSITDVWEPIEEGLVPLEMTRHVSMISITLSTRELNKNSPGYQAPLYVEQPKQQRKFQQTQQYPQRQQHYQQLQPRQPQGYVNEDSYGRGHGRGRGRGRGRGWAQGGYNGYDGYGGYNNYQENGGWNSNWGGRGGGRGRGYGYPGMRYERGRGGGDAVRGRGYVRGRGRMGGRGRDNQA